MVDRIKHFQGSQGKAEERTLTYYATNVNDEGRLVDDLGDSIFVEPLVLTYSPKYHRIAASEEMTRFLLLAAPTTPKSEMCVKLIAEDLSGVKVRHRLLDNW